MPVEIKMIAGAFLVIGITGTVISLVDGTMTLFGLFVGIAVISTFIITRR
jgi:hypothetical protein